MVALLLKVTVAGGTEAMVGKLPPIPEAPAEDGPVLAPVERDEETLEMFANFLEESEERLDDADGVLLDLENSDNQAETGKEPIDNLFRTYHSIKGVASFLECTEISGLSHTTETMMSKVRDGSIPLSGVVIDLVLESTTVIRALLDKIRTAIEAGTEIGHGAIFRMVLPLLG